MTLPTPDSPRPFRDLERALLRRRLAALDPLLRLELLAIAALVAGFVFWQVRMVLANAAFHAGAIGAARALAFRLGVLTAAGGVLAGAAHARLLAVRLPGPPWLTLPIAVDRIHRHLGWNSGHHAFWVLPLVAGVLVAGLGLMPPLWLLLLAAATLGALLVVAHLACAVADRLARIGLTRRPGAPPQVALLCRDGAVATRRRAPAAHWALEPAWRALLRNDARLALRHGPSRRRLLAALACTVLAAAAWQLPGGSDPYYTRVSGLAPVLGFGLALFAAGLFAQWLIALVNSDPPLALRPLPLGLGAAWGARVAWVSLATLTLVSTQAAASTPLEPASRQLLIFGVGLAALTIGLLALNYAISLYPRAAEADRMFTLSCGLALAGSLMIPLMGWIVLLTAVLHSLRRVPRWRRPEAD